MAEMRYSNGQRTTGQRWIRCWEEFEAESLYFAQFHTHKQSHRGTGTTDYQSVVLLRVTSRDLRAFQLWLAERFPLPAGELDQQSSEGDRAAAETGLRRGDRSSENHGSQASQSPSRPRFYFDDSSISERLWKAARANGLASQGLQESTRDGLPGNWIGALRLLAMLDRVAAELRNASARPWLPTPEENSDLLAVFIVRVYLHPQSPNHESHESWPLVGSISHRGEDSRVQWSAVLFAAHCVSSSCGRQAPNAAMELDGS